MKRELLPFTPERDDPLFVEIEKKLRGQGVGLREDELFAIYLEVYEHVVCLTEEFDGWWTRLGKEDVVDVSTPAFSFYNITLARMRQAITRMSDEMARKSHALLTKERTPEVTLAENAFFNAMIHDIKTSEMVAYRS